MKHPPNDFTKLLHPPVESKLRSCHSGSLRLPPFFTSLRTTIRHSPPDALHFASSKRHLSILFPIVRIKSITLLAAAFADTSVSG